MNSHQNPIIEMSHCSKTYRGPAGAVPVLSDCFLSVQAGESVSIIGPSGSGKSTLLHLIGALDQPSAGTVMVNGTNIGSLSQKQMTSMRNSVIGFVFQDHFLLPQCTVMENVLVPCLGTSAGSATQADYERAERLLRRVGLGERMDHLPGQLSGGECQRVAVIRALINKPAVVLADEPTGSLDHDSAVSLVSVLQQLREDERITLVMVTHAIEIARTTDRVLALKDGKLEPDR